MQLISYFSSFSSCYSSSARLSLAKESAPTLELNEENIKDFQHTSSLPSSEITQLFYQQIKRLPGLSYFFKKHSKLEKKSLDYTEILEKLENNKLIDFDQKKQKILSLIKQEENYFLAKEGNIQKYFYRIEDILTNLWGDIAAATDGFLKPSAFTSIKLMDNEIDAWLDVKKFRNAAIKKLLYRFNSDQLASILANISLDQLTDLVADVTPISQQSQQSNKRIRIDIDIDQTIRQEIDKRLLNSLQEAKNILSHPGLQFLGKSDSLYWQATLAASSLNLIRRLTKTAETLRMLAQANEAPSQKDSEAHSLLHSATQSFYEQLLTDLPKYQSRLHIQALQKLKQILSILEEYSRPPLSLNQQMTNCRHNLCKRMTEKFHHTLINTDNAQDIIHSIDDLLRAYTELNPSSDNNTKVDSLQEFIDGSIKKLKPYQLNQLTHKLASAPFNGLRNALSDALNLEVQKVQNDSGVIKYLGQYELQQTQIEQILKCLKIPFKSRNPLSNLPYQLLNYFFAPHSLTTDYLNSIRNIFKIEISISDKPEQKQNIFVRVLSGDVPVETTAEEIQELLQKKNKKEHSPNAWMKDCDIDAQYITDASRGIIRNIAFNGKRVFNELNKGEETEEERKRRPYIVASLLRNFWRSDKLTGIASAYVSQKLFNLITPILPINGVVTLPGGKAITALLLENCSMTCNVITPNKKNSARIEVSFKHTNINQALTDGGPIPLKSKGNYLSWDTTLEVDLEQKQEKNQDKSPVELVGKKISFAYSIDD